MSTTNITANSPTRAPALVRLLHMARDRRLSPTTTTTSSNSHNNSTNERTTQEETLLNDLPLLPRDRGTTTTLNSRPIRPSTTHLNVSCDECGEMPIVGTRFKSNVQPNYDVCRHCLEENHLGNEHEFTALETYGAATTEPPTGRSVAVHSLYDLQELIENDPTVEDLAFYVGTLTSPSLGQTVRRVLSHHPSIKSVHIHIFGTENATETVTALAEGLQHNKSVLSVSWNILSNRGQRGLSEEATQALQNLMEHNTTIKYMFFQRQRGFGFSAVEAQDDALVNKIFDALKKTHLHTVRFSGHAPVSNENKKKAWAAMMSNPHLRRVKASFETTDYQLDLLQADKKHKWMERWTHLDAQEDERWNVLKEVLDSQFVDKVPVLYHFLRNQPECLLQWTENLENRDQDEDMNDVKMEYERTAWA
jgi:Zinc finger, ZZ type